MDSMHPLINLPAVLPTEAEPAPPRTPLMPERSDFLEGDSPAAAKVEAFLARALDATGSNANITTEALVLWICDALLSNHSVKAYDRDLMDFLRQMQAQGVDALHVTADHVKLYKRALLQAGRTSATVARRLSVIRGAYKELATKGLVPWRPPFRGVLLDALTKWRRPTSKWGCHSHDHPAPHERDVARQHRRACKPH
jgi:Phage integrase, N-terminal SAM-like domain